MDVWSLGTLELKPPPYTWRLESKCIVALGSDFSPNCLSIARIWSSDTSNFQVKNCRFPCSHHRRTTPLCPSSAHPTHQHHQSPMSKRLDMWKHFKLVPHPTKTGYKAKCHKCNELVCRNPPTVVKHFKKCVGQTSDGKTLAEDGNYKALPSAVITGVASRADPVHLLLGNDKDEAEPEHSEQMDDIAIVMNKLEVHVGKTDKQPKLGLLASWIKKCGHVEQHAFDKLVGLMIIDQGLPYATLDCVWFKMMVRVLNPKMVPLSSYRLKKHIIPEIKADVLDEMEKVFTLGIGLSNQIRVRFVFCD